MESNSLSLYEKIMHYEPWQIDSMGNGPTRGPSIKYIRSQSQIKSQSQTRSTRNRGKKKKKKKKKSALKINIGISCTRNRHQVLGMYVDAEINVR